MIERIKQLGYERLAAYAVLALVGLMMLWTVWPSLNGDGYLASWDAGGHLLKAEYFATELLPDFRLDGWFPTWHGGFDLFQYYPPLLYYLLGPLTYVFSPELALRLFTAALWIGLLPATYYLLRSFDLGRLPAALGSGLLLSLNASFGVGLGALYGVGLLPNGLGFILAIWALGRLKRDLFELRPAPKLVVTGVVIGLLLLAHTFSAYWFGVASLSLAVAAAWGRPKGPVFKRFALVSGIGLVLSAYWWLPLAGSLSAMGDTGAIQQQSAVQILADLLLSRDSGGWAVSLLAVGGLAYLGFRKHYRELGFFLVVGVVTLLLSINAINGILPFGGVVGSSQFIRFHAFFALLVMVWGALGIAGLWHAVGRLPRSWQAPGMAGFGLVLGLVAALVALPTLARNSQFIRVVDNEPTAELGVLAEELRERLQPGESVLSEFNWDARFLLGSPHFVNQRLPREVPGLWDLDGNFPEGTRGSADPVLIASVLNNGAFVASRQDYLRDRGVRFIVSTHPTTRTSLDGHRWLRRVWTGKVLSLYELKDFDRPFGLPPAAAARLTSASFTDGEYRLAFAPPVTLPAGTALTVSHHPWLYADAGGEPVRTTDASGRLGLAEAAETDSLRIRYEPPWWVFLARAVSLGGVFGLAVLVARRRRITAWLGSRVSGRGRRKR